MDGVRPRPPPDRQIHNGLARTSSRPLSGSGLSHGEVAVTQGALSSYALDVEKTTSLFTDIVGSTKLATALGDRGWAELLERHHAAVRVQIARFQGQEMDTSGDGFFIIFPGPAQAIEAAGAIIDAVQPLGLTIRVGMHTGDCYVADGKCTGLAIHIAARIVDLAAPGEVLVSEPVRAKSVPGLDFLDRGVHTLRGVPGKWHLYALRTSPGH
jgi:class 3 adenylate cyclase